MRGEPGEGSFALTARRATLLFLLILILRIAVAAQFRGNFDTQSYLIVAQATLRGENVYAATDRYNYSPLWSFVVAGVWWVARPNVGLFMLLLGLLQTLADAATAALLYRIAGRRLGFEEAGARRAALLFFSNPVSVLVSCTHGQFDGTSIVFLLAAIWFATAPDAERKRPAVVASLSLSLLVKHVTAFHPFLFWRRVRRPGLTLGAVVVPYVVFVLSFVPYASSFATIGRNVLLYPTYLLRPRGPYPGGLQAFVSFRSGSTLGFNILALAVVGWVLWRTRGLELPRACLILFLAVLTFLPAFSLQYLVWPIALGSLYVSPAYALFSGVTGIVYSSFTLLLPWPIAVDPRGAWLAGLIWFLGEVARLRDPADRPGGAASGVALRSDSTQASGQT